MFATNYIKSFNERIRSSIFSLICRLHQSDNLFYYFTDIHYKSYMYTYWGRYYTHDICIVFFNQI